MRYLLMSLTIAVAAAAAAAQDRAVELLKGATWKFSTDDGKTFTADAPPAGAKQMVARATFKVQDPSAIAVVYVTPDATAPYRYACALNGTEAVGPVKEMLYRAIPLDAKDLLKSSNTLIIRGPTPAGGKMRAAVLGYPAAMVAIQSGPVLGAFGSDYVTVTCRTNMPACVTVKATPTKPQGGEVSATSDRGFYHRLKLRIPAGTRELTYQAVASAGRASKAEGPFTVCLPDLGGNEPLRIVAAGDSRTNFRDWLRVANAIAKARPHLTVFSGDMVSDGRWYGDWDQEFFGPGKALLTTVPFYAVWGNHDGPASTFAEFFHTPSPDGKAVNWEQQVGSALLIGIHGGEDWSAASKNLAWLEGVLKDSQARFIFLFSHYPAYSSGRHGKANERPIVTARTHIMPLLAKYKATAMFAGHDHNYERSEPPADKAVTSGARRIRSSATIPGENGCLA